MTKQELIAGVDALTRRMTRWAGAWLLSVFAVPVLVQALGLDPKQATSPIARILPATLMAVILGWGAAIALVWYRSMRRSGLVCPHCNRLLIAPLMQIAVASGNCGKCGKQIVTAES